MEHPKNQAGLTPRRQAWLSFCLMCIIVTESIGWRKFVRAGLDSYSEALLSWHFRHPMTWGLLLSVSVNLVLKNFSVQEGILLIDDTGKKRSKVTQKIPDVHYFKNKEGTGQEVVLLVLVTPLVTIPVAFEFYPPDPAYTQWARQNKRLKKPGVPSCQRPSKPAKNSDYPTKQQLALRLLTKFARDCSFVKVKAVLADALYGNANFMRETNQILAETQVISQLRHNQKIQYRGRTWPLSNYFKSYPGVSQNIQVRGMDTAQVIVGRAHLYVIAAKGKCFVIAIRYPDEPEYRYLVVYDLANSRHCSSLYFKRVG